MFSFQVAALEASNSATAQQLSEKETEAERLSKEFDNYKLRAQSVLKQSKDQQVKVNCGKFTNSIFQTRWREKLPRSRRSSLPWKSSMMLSMKS